jgi:cellulose synthase/poly-beta-1,6-N-acetylglucosamine synthase-like glycosyltransferase
MNPASNRNYAANQLDTDIISFIDGDDISHPQRIEYIYNSFLEYNCDAILHDYKSSNFEDFEFLSNRYESIFYFHNYVNTPGQDIMSCSHNDTKHLPYHNAHVSVLKRIFDIHKYNTDESIKYKEDSEYNNRLVKNGIRISYISNPLSLYIK